MKRLALLLPLLALAAAPARAEDTATNAATALPAAAEAATPLPEGGGENADSQDFETPEVFVRLESVDAAVEALAAAAGTRAGVDAFLDKIGLRFLRRDLPIRAGLWNVSLENPRKTDYVVLLPFGDDDDPPLVFASRPERKKAADAVRAAPRTKPDACLSVWVPSTRRAARAVRAEGVDMGNRLFSLSLAEPGTVGKKSPSGGQLFGGTELFPYETKRDWRVRASLALTEEDGFRFAMERAPAGGPEEGGGAAAAAIDAAGIPDEALGSVPGGSLAWRLRAPDPSAPDGPDLWLKLVLEDVPLNRRRAPAYEAFADALAAFGGGGRGAVRAAVEPAAGGRFRLVWREEGADAEALRALGRAFAALCESERELTGTNALAAFRPEVVETAPDGLSGTVRRAGRRFARIFGEEAPFRVEPSGGGFDATLGGEAAGFAPGWFQPVRLDEARRWFPGFRPSSLWGVRPEALRSKLAPQISTKPSDDALLSASGRWGDEWVWTVTAPAGQVRALRGLAEMLERAESKSHAESAESAEDESHAESAENAEPEPHAEGAEGAEFAELLARAEAGDSDAMVDVGNRYGFGPGAERDAQKALEWYRKAAEAGNPRGEGAIGQSYALGLGVEIDAVKAFEWFRKSAEHGNGQSMHDLGNLYDRGEGVEKDYTKAMEWYRKAIETGNRKAAPFAEFQIGEMYRCGHGVETNAVEAVEWYRKAAEAGHPIAMVMLWKWYYFGIGVEEDKAVAEEWKRKAYAVPDDDPVFGKAARYVKKRIWEEYTEWLRKTAEDGDAEAQLEYGNFLASGVEKVGIEADPAEGVRWIRRAAEQGHAKAQNTLGWFYWHGEGVATNMEEALHWIRRSAESGRPQAQLRLGYLLVEGVGAAPDRREGALWLRRAAAQGEDEAGRRLAELWWRDPAAFLQSRVDYEMEKERAGALPGDEEENGAGGGDAAPADRSAAAIDAAIRARAAAAPGDLATRILAEMLAPHAFGPDRDRPDAPRIRATLRLLAEKTADGSLAKMPAAAGWGMFYDLTMRDGADDPALRWASALGQKRWGWDAQALEQLAALEERVAGPDATPFQRMLAAQARAALDPADGRAAAFRAAADAWRATLDPAVPAAAVDGFLASLGLREGGAADARELFAPPPGTQVEAEMNYYGVPRDWRESEWGRRRFADFVERADAGDAYAQGWLARLYWDGDYGVERDLGEAARRLRLAAEAGDDWARISLAYALRDGTFGERDAEQARAWLRRSAEQGWIHAQYKLGASLWNGAFGETNLVEAAEWLRRAAGAEKVEDQFEEERTLARYWLGELLSRPSFPGHDPAEAARWLRLAAAAGHAEAAKALEALEKAHAEEESHAESAENEEPKTHAESAEGAESGGTAPHGALPPAAAAATPLSEGGEPNGAEGSNSREARTSFAAEPHPSFPPEADPSFAAKPHPSFGGAAAAPPPLHAAFVSAVYLPLLEREVLAPLEGRDAEAPWRRDALAAVRDWLARVARCEPRCDPAFLARARSAAGRGCRWPAVRYLAAVAAWESGRGGEEHRDAARRAMEEAVRAAARDPSATELSAFLVLRDFCSRAATGERAWTQALAARYAALAAARPWTGEEARALWWLGRGAFAEGAAADAVAALVWGAGGDGRGGASTNAWLREMSAGAAELRRAWAARGEGAEAALADDARAGWERHRARASERFAAAAALEPAFPEAPLCLVACWLGRPAEARRWLDEAVRREFDCPGARSAYLWGLRPRWGGSTAAMIDFGDECLAALDGRPGADPRAALAWAEARFGAASELGDGWEEAFRGAGTVEAADRLGAALAAAPGAGVPERRDALWLPVCPLYANNRIDRLARACDAFGAALGNACPLAVDFDESHPMHRYKFGLLFGLSGYHGETTSAALLRWREAGDPAGAAALLEPLVGKTRYGSGLDDWEQSWICGALAELGAELAPAGGGPYTLLPRSGRSGRSKFWESWNESVRAADGAWTAPGPGAGEMRSVAPVLPADFALALAVRPLDDGAACRLYALPDVGEWDTAARPALLLERDETGWILGWATLRHVDDAETFGGDELADRFGPRTALVEDADGLVRFELLVRGGDATVRTPSGELPALALPGRFLRVPHRLGFAGLGFRLVEATARAP